MVARTLLACCLAVLTASSAGAAPDPIFQGPYHLRTGRQIQSISAGDLNGDGRVDVVTGNYDAGASVLLRAPDGTLGAPVTYGVQPANYSTRLADFNRDGKLDILIAGPGVMSTILGNGDGTFRDAIDLGEVAFTHTQNGTAFADLNGDSRLDIVATGVEDLVVLLGNGDGTFAAAAHLDPGGTHTSVDIADFNTDGKPDLITTNLSEKTVSVLFGNGDGTFEPEVSTTIESPLTLAVGNLDSDARPDLVVNTSSGLFVLRNQADGTFGSPSEVSVYSSWIDLRELDGDGHVDLVTGPLAVYPGNGAGGFGPRRDYPLTGTSGPSTYIVDLNQDGRLDFLAGDLCGLVVETIQNTDGSFGYRNSIAVSGIPFDVAAADLNDDGRQDLVTADATGISLLLGTGGGAFAPHRDVPAGAPGERPWRVAVGDIDGDGHKDVVTANLSGSTSPDRSVSVLRGRGDGTFDPHAEYPVGSPIEIFLADLDADGRDDVVTFSLGKSFSVHLGKSDGTLGPRSDIAVGDYVVTGLVADIDGDAKIDALVSRLESDAVWLKGNGDGSFQPPASAPFLGAQSLSIGDFDEDGNRDVLAGNEVLLGDGHGAFTHAGGLDVGGCPVGGGVDVADLDGDGHADLAMSVSNIAGLFVFRGDGHGGFGPFEIYHAGLYSPAIAVADLDGDGLTDAAIANPSEGVTVQLNLGSGPNHDPDIDGAHAANAIAWPPSGGMESVVIEGVQDADGDPLTVVATAVTQDEVVSDGGACPDAIIVDGVARVRRERSSKGNGRVYEITFIASDGHGGQSEGTVRVCVPHDRGRKSSECVDDGQRYSSVEGCAGSGRSARAAGTIEVATHLDRHGRTLAYALPRNGRVELCVYDVAGRKITTLLEEEQAEGDHRLEWSTASLQHGVYFLLMRLDRQTVTRTTIVVR